MTFFKESIGRCKRLYFVVVLHILLENYLYLAHTHTQTHTHTHKERERERERERKRERERGTHNDVNNSGYGHKTFWRGEIVKKKN